MMSAKEKSDLADMLYTMELKISHKPIAVEAPHTSKGSETGSGESGRARPRWW